MLIGLTGGMASGKNYIASIFEQKGFAVLDADVVSRIVVEKGSEGLDRVIKHFGKIVLSANGEMDRQVLRDIIISDLAQKKKLEEILHPLIGEYTIKWYKKLRSTNDQIKALYHAPLLIESGAYKDCDKVGLVYVTKEVQLERIRLRGYPPFEGALKLIESQMPYSEKLKYADFIINNNGTKEEAIQEIERVLNDLQLLQYAVKQNSRKTRS